MGARFREFLRLRVDKLTRSNLKGVLRRDFLRDKFGHFSDNFISQTPYLREAKPGCFQTRVFPTFFGKGPDCVADPFGTVPRRCS